MPQPYPDPTNLTGVVQIASYTNTITGDWFWTLGVVAGFAIIFVGLLLARSKIGIAMLNAGWISTVLATLLWLVGLVPSKIMLIFVFVATAGGLISYFEDN